MTGRKLNAFARLAFQRYFIKGNLTNVCSFTESSSSVKCKLCGNWLLRSFWPFPLFRYKKMSVKETSFFTMCHYSEFHQTTYVNFRRNDLQNDVRFSLGKCFPATQYVDCVTKKLSSIPAFEMTPDRTAELFQKQIT